MVDTLHKICIKQTAEHIFKGRLKTAHKKLDAKSSNLVFDEFGGYAGHEGYVEGCQYIKNLLTVTEMEYSVDEFCEKQRQMIYDQDVRQLRIVSLNSWNMFHLAKDENDNKAVANNLEDEEETVIVDIAAVVEKLLNPESRQKLEFLEIGGDKVDLPEGWAEKVANLLPSLQTLKMHCLCVEEKEVRIIYNRYPNLKQLLMTQANISSLTGISKLSNLTFLDIGAIPFNRKENLKELFELKNLRTLNMEGYSEEVKSDSMVWYLEFGKCLPQLEWLVCSYCKMTEEMLQKLLKTHKSLKYVDLIATALENRSQVAEYKGVRLLTMGCFTDCLATLRFHLQEKVSTEFIKPVLTKIRLLLEDQYESIDRKLLSECLALMCQAIELNFELRKPAAEILERMFRHNRGRIYSFSEKQHLIFRIISTFEADAKWEPVEDETELDDLIMDDNIWKVLKSEAIINTSPENLNTICEKAAESVHLWASEESEPIYSNMAVLAEHLDKMSIGRADDKDLVQDVLVALRFHIATQSDEERTLRYLITIIQKVYLIRSENYFGPDEVDEESIIVFCEAINTFKENNDVQTHLMVTLGIILKKSHEDAYQTVMNELEERDQYRTFLKMLYEQDTEKQKETILLFYWTFFYAGAETKVGLYRLKDKAREVVVKEVRAALVGFEYAEESGEFDGLKWILKKRTSRSTRMMCRWIVTWFGGELEEQRPRRKRRRN